MKAFSLFPGCSLEGTARDYGESVEAVAEALGLELGELEDWSCCGASSAHCTDEFLSIALPARNLMLAQKTGLDLVVPCAACFSRLKAAEKALTRGGVDVGVDYRGDIRVLHLLDLFTRPEILEAVDEKIQRPLTGLKVASYYGCLIVRPPETTGAEHWEDPRTMDDLVRRLGGESVSWPYKTECCGGGLVLTMPDMVHRMTGRLLDMAQEAEADCIVTACPLCQSNLDTRQQEIGAASGRAYDIPIFYFTELLGLAFGIRKARRWLRRHFISPKPLLRAREIL
jgi:heterodisulfide reductase subunit B